MIARARQVDDSSLAAQIAALALRCSRITDLRPDPSTPFAHMGLDSIGTIELAAAIEEELGLDVPLDLVSDCTDARTLAARLEQSQSGLITRDEALAEMLADAVLADDVRPPLSSSARGADRGRAWPLRCGRHSPDRGHRFSRRLARRGAPSDFPRHADLSRALRPRACDRSPAFPSVRLRRRSFPLRLPRSHRRGRPVPAAARHVE